MIDFAFYHESLRKELSDLLGAEEKYLTVLGISTTSPDGKYNSPVMFAHGDESFFERPAYDEIRGSMIKFNDALNSRDREFDIFAISPMIVFGVDSDNGREAVLYFAVDTGDETASFDERQFVDRAAEAIDRVLKEESRTAYVAWRFGILQKDLIESF